MKWFGDLPPADEIYYPPAGWHEPVSNEPIDASMATSAGTESAPVIWLGADAESDPVKPSPSTASRRPNNMEQTSPGLGGAPR